MSSRNKDPNFTRTFIEKTVIYILAVLGMVYVGLHMEWGHKYDDSVRVLTYLTLVAMILGMFMPRQWFRIFLGACGVLGYFHYLEHSHILATGLSCIVTLVCIGQVAYANTKQHFSTEER